jgi:perosamine synthetase
MPDTSNSNTPAKSRRTFMQTSAATVAGLGVVSARISSAASDTLALNGGPKAVTFPSAKQSALTRWPRYGAGEKKALIDMIESNKYYEELPIFEKEWKAYTKAPFVKAHMNGTSALNSMFFALDLEPGSEILVQSYTFFATVLPMRFFGYVPIFVDIDPKTGCFDLEDAKKKITPNTKAILPMHSWGMPCEMDKISDYAKEKGLILCEDCAHAHGASMQGKHVGTFGAMSIFSFQATKVMPAIEGGMGMYQTREYFERASAYGHYEDPPKFPADSPYRKYKETGFGQKYRMHPLAAAIGRQQLSGLDARSALVHANVSKLNSRLTQLAGISEPFVRPDQKRAYYSANMLFLDEKKAGITREKMLAALKAEGVRASVWNYPEQHNFTIYHEAKWWHHAPVIPESMPGGAQVNNSHFFVPLFYGEAPELIEQYAKAFEKVWANRAKLA